MKEVKAVGVYCSSCDDLDDVYVKAALELGQQLAYHNITMVYGGGGQGLMGEASNAVIRHGGRVIGFMPHHLKDREALNLNITELHMVDTMHTRKRLMFEHSDAFLILPGGFGTLDETFELITWRQLNLHKKIIIFVNINEYWKPLKELIENIFEQHFAAIEHKNYFRFVNSVSESFQALLKAPTPTTPESVPEWV